MLCRYDLQVTCKSLDSQINKGSFYSVKKSLEYCTRLGNRKERTH